MNRATLALTASLFAVGCGPSDTPVESTEKAEKQDQLGEVTVELPADHPLTTTVGQCRVNAGGGYQEVFMFLGTTLVADAEEAAPGEDEEELEEEFEDGYPPEFYEEMRLKAAFGEQELNDPRRTAYPVAEE